MLTLRTLGAIGLTGQDGRELDGLLRQPKRLALLIYLASPQPGAWHRRETIMALFWPSFGSTQARVALRNALYVIRQEIGADALRTRGDEEVSVDPAHLVSDAGVVHGHLAAGRNTDGLAAYRGDFLPGFYVSDADGFERWVDDERRDLQGAARAAAAQLSRQCERDGNLAGAVDLQRRLLDIDPDDETEMRRLMVLLDRTGERAQALAAYDRLRNRLQSQFSTKPTTESVQLAEQIRSHIDAPATNHATTKSPETTGPGSRGPQSPAIAPQLAPAPARAARRWWITGTIAAGALVALGFASRPSPDGVTGTRTLLVLPMENETGDKSNEYVATGLAEGVAAQLGGMGTFTIRSAARSTWPRAIKDSLRMVGSRFGATIVLRSRLSMMGDSLQADAQLVDMLTGATRHVGTQRFTPEALRDAASGFAAAIAGEVFRTPIAEVPHPAAHAIDPESYRLTLAGWQQLLGAKDEDGARELFMRATEADRLHARAWSGLSSTWAAATTNGQVPFDDGYARAEQAARRALAIDSLEGTALANLGMMEALKARDLAAGEPYFRRAIAAEPANPEIFMVYGAALRFAGEWERAHDQIRVARQLDPLSAYYAGREANGALCENRPADALRYFRIQVALDGRDRDGVLGVAIALARLHRWDEAIAEYSALARARSDTALARIAASAHGEAGYWELKHHEGAMLLARRTAMSATRWVAPFLLGVAEIGAGHLDRGMDLLEAELKAGSRMLYKLPCNSELDEARATERFKKLQVAAGMMPVRASTR